MQNTKMAEVMLGSQLAATAACAGDWLILKPESAPQAYTIAATEFQKFYMEVTGRRLEITAKSDEKSNLVVIGSDSVNSFTRTAVELKIIAPLGLGADVDAYCIRSATKEKRHFLFLAGGNGRGTLYAVYSFFERQAGCRYFWDGDIIPKKNEIEMNGLDICESPRFAYRGTRYFAHRSLDRFQAEHWSRKQWEQEIDWLLKKRLNLFMLRIGMDDIFQKAFPDAVEYPPTDQPLPEAMPRSFDDRTSAWDLRYRGELRKYVLNYAAERGLMHPEDTGTMTHWYSRTPKSFIEKIKPSFMPQFGGAYRENQTGAVWDIREDRNLDNYWKLTQTHIDNYGRPEIFHTIGLAERDIFPEKEKNMEMKYYAYRRIIEKVRQHYPQVPLLIASWDFYMPGWSGREVNNLVSQLNPEKTIIFDYTSDLPQLGKSSDFRSWGVVGKFPWTFGIFHAYEWENELRGNYDLIKERMPIAAADPMCKGFVYWPETSHSDILMIEFFTKNSWKPDTLTPEELLPEFCNARYQTDAGKMLEAWNAAMPLIKLHSELGPVFNHLANLAHWEINAAKTRELADECIKRKSVMKEVPRLCRMLADLPFGKGNAFIDRDAIDLARTAAGRIFAYAIRRYQLTQGEWLDGKTDSASVAEAGKRATAVMASLRDILALHEDYSMKVSMDRLRAVHPVNTAFEQALKGNAENWYCRAYIYELCAYYYLPQMNIYTNWIDEHVGRGNRSIPMKPASPLPMQAVTEEFYAKPLAEMAPPVAANPGETYRRTLEKLAETTESFDFSQ